MLKAKLLILGYIACITMVCGGGASQSEDCEDVIRPQVSDSYNLKTVKTQKAAPAVP